MAPTTTKQWIFKGTNGFDDLAFTEAEIPPVGENDVLVHLRGASLNYRDLIIPKGLYPFPIKFPVVAGSDGAGEVIAVGSKVTRWKPGDRVVTLFNQSHYYNPIDPIAVNSGLGGALDGTLRQYAVFNENGLVRAPSNLNYVEAATLTCAGLTAWNALFGGKPLKPGQWVLVQGTGGVSIFGLQFAKAAGARVIATTSTAEKAEILKKLGADHVINYKEDPNWGETARKLTDGEGVDQILEVGGPQTQEQSIKAVRSDGVINIIGLLGGVEPKGDARIIHALWHLCTFRGVFVGPRGQFEEMVRAIEANDIKPVVDKEVFPLEKAKEAFEYMEAQRHFGKVGIAID